MMKSLCLIACFAMVVACNNHPVEKVDEILNSVSRVENSLPPKTKLDFLFVIDNSGSMCEEQERLSKNFTLFSNFIFDELKGTADYRIAVTTTDIGSAKVQSVEDDKRGAFLYSPADANIPVCQDGGKPNTMDCPTTGPDNNIISSDEIDKKNLNDLKSELGNVPNNCSGDVACEEKAYKKAYLEKIFRCSATLGTSGYFIEKGLEAMRLSLSCNGPNRSKFGSCCVCPDGSNNCLKDEQFYNPLCEPSAEDVANGLPAFLRPEAKLVVIFISDENDCSTPNDNAPLSSRLICRPSGNTDTDGDSIPDIYRNEYRSAAQEFFTRDCGSYGIEECRSKRCDLSYAQNIECEWFRSALTPVTEYKDFLQRLKAKPDTQIIVSTVVGFRGYTEKGNEIVYNQAQDYANPVCAEMGHPSRKQEICCPEGKCQKIDVSFSCEIQEKKISAGSGTRYLELAEALADNGLGCNKYEEPELDAGAQAFLRKSFCLDPKPLCAANGGNCGNDIRVELKCKDTTPGECPSQAQEGVLAFDTDWKLNLEYGKCPARVELVNRNLPSDLQAHITYTDESNTQIDYNNQSCVNICVDDFVEPLKIIKNKVAQLLSTYCLDRLPACRVINPDGSTRPCSIEETANPVNYAFSILVSRQCLNENCDTREPLTALSYRADWNLSIAENGACAATVQLVGIPPAGSELFIEFLSQSGAEDDTAVTGTTAGATAGATAGSTAGTTAGESAGATAGATDGATTSSK